MIITIKGADFSENKIGTLSSCTISRNLGNGTTYNGPKFIEKNSRLDATITLANGYEFGTVSITMGGDVISAHNISENILTISIGTVTGNVVINVATSWIGEEEEPEEPETPTNYIFTINPTPTSATVTLTATGYSNVSGTGSKSITVANGTTVNWSVSASGYTTRTGNWTISGGNKTENITLVAEATDTATLSVTASPTDAQIICYAKNKLAGGGTTTGTGYVTVTPSTENVTWQVTKDGYLSNGGQINKLAENVQKDITLVPFSSGNWVQLDTSTFEEVKDYYIGTSGKNAGPYNTWKYLLCPVTPGKKYRVVSTAGQNALLWMFFAEKPQGETGAIKPISSSTNTGMTTKIADEVVAPEGAAYLVVNGRVQASDYKPTIERLDN